MDMQLNDKTALVTGASVGIGEGIALALAAPPFFGCFPRISSKWRAFPSFSKISPSPRS